MLIFCGDIHGEYEKLIRTIKQYDLSGCTIIQAGDFGIGFEQRRYKELRKLQVLNDWLKNRAIHLYAIRGNHDDPAFFTGLTNVYFTEFKFSNITLLPDYTILRTQDKNILFVGGALSIDRKPNPNIKDMYGKPWKGRVEGINYWNDENFILDKDKIQKIKEIDIVITHTCPSFCQPILKTGAEKWFNTDETLEKELAEERDNMAEMYNLLIKNNKISDWIYGHYHFSNFEIYNHIKFKLLNIFEFYELR